jgi:dienelactone hydrolase
MNVEYLNLTTSNGATTAYVAHADGDVTAAVVLIQEWWGHQSTHSRHCRPLR